MKIKRQNILISVIDADLHNLGSRGCARIEVRIIRKKWWGKREYYTNIELNKYDTTLLAMQLDRIAQVRGGSDE